MSNPLISILHPTARVKPYPSFPTGWRGAFEQFAATAVHPRDIEYILIVHESRWVEFWANFGGRDAVPEGDQVSIVEYGHELYGWFIVIQNHGRDCVVDQINAGAEASRGRLLIGIMDDLEAPERWDEKLLAIVDDSWVDGYCPEAVIDLTGESSDWIVYSAMTRARYEKQGFILDPEFESMFADNYYSHMAHKDGVVINGRHLGFKHRHPINDPAQQMDEVYAIQNRKEAYAQGQATFLRKVHGTRSLYVCLPGEKFSYQWVTNWFALLNHLNQGMRFLLTPVFGFTTNVHVTRIVLAEGVLSKAGSQADLVLWADDDNLLTPDQFEMLLGVLESRPDIDIVVCPTWCDNDGLPDENGQPKAWMISCGRQGPEFECKKLSQEDVLNAIDAGHMLITSDDIAPDAFWSGFPVVLMRGSVLRKLGARSFCPIVRDDVEHGFVSEDAAFFYRAHLAGLKSAVHLGCFVPHLKLRAIAPQYIPISERNAALKERGEISELELVMRE